MNVKQKQKKSLELINAFFTQCPEGADNVTDKLVKNFKEMQLIKQSNSKMFSQLNKEVCFFVIIVIFWEENGVDSEVVKCD